MKVVPSNTHSNRVDQTDNGGTDVGGIVGPVRGLLIHQSLLTLVTRVDPIRSQILLTLVSPANVSFAIDPPSDASDVGPTDASDSA